MCGIFGRFSVSGRLRADAGDQSRLDVLRHRGPDATGWHRDERVFMGFRRLSIIDVSGGDQPLYSGDRQAVLTLNGEIYNHKALRGSLRGAHRFASNSDAEVLVHRYVERGTRGLVDGVNGMFGFALYDGRRRRVVLGRDRAGQKPVYWSFDDGELRWASELKVLAGAGRRINRQAVGDYLRFGYVPAPLTMFEGVYKLPAGCLLVCDAGGAPRVDRYWSLRYPGDGDRSLRAGEAEAWRERLREGLRAAVGRRLESEVPMGFLLSGGVDSASVFALGAEALDDPVSAFTVGFDDASVDETALAASAAERWEAQHHVRTLTDGEHDLDSVLYLAEEPISTDALLPTARVFEQVADAGFTTVLTGEGSDEIMAGYRKFAAGCSWVRAGATWPREGSPLSRYLAHEEFVFPSAAEREALIGGPVDDGRFAELEAQAEPLDPLGQMLLFEANLRLPDRINPRLDRLSMAYSVEARAPFMDYELQELCAAIPHRLRRGATVDKLLLRDAMRDHLPPGIVDAVKAPFRAPTSWFVEPTQLGRELADDEVEAAGLVDVDAVRRLRSAPADDRHSQERLYSLLVLHGWHRSFVRERPLDVGVVTGPVGLERRCA